MKKRTILVLACVLLALSLCACGAKGDFAAADVQLTFAGVTVTADTPVDTLLAALGGDYAYTEAISCVYTGMDKTYTYPGATLYTYPDGEEDRLMELYCEADVQTSRGIGIGASKQDIVAQYGGGYVESGSVLRYELPAQADDYVPASLYFLMTDGKATAIAITAEHRAE